MYVLYYVQIERQGGRYAGKKVAICIQQTVDVCTSTGKDFRIV